MHDGSRHFGELRETTSWYELHDHIKGLRGASEVTLLTDHVTEAWIDFTYRGHQFSVNNQHGNYWFFVEDPQCPDDVLDAVMSHCKLLLEGGRVESTTGREDA